MKTGVSAAGQALQRSVLGSPGDPSWQQWELGGSHPSCTPSSCQAALSQASCCLPGSTAGCSMLPLAKAHRNGQEFLSWCSDFASQPPVFWLEEKPLQLLEGDSGRQPGQRCFAVEQSWAIDPGSTLELNLEIWKQKNPFWCINLIFCIFRVCNFVL